MGCHGGHRNTSMSTLGFCKTSICWREHNKNLIHVPLDSGLLEAVKLLIENKIHRLPVIDPDNGDVVYILNQKPLLKFLFNVPNLRSSNHLKRSIAQAGVGSEGRLTNIYSKFDVINLAATKSYDDLEITLKEAT